MMKNFSPCFWVRGLGFVAMILTSGNALSQNFVPGNPAKYDDVPIYGECVSSARTYASQVLKVNIPPIGTYHPRDPYAHWIWNDTRLQPSNTIRISAGGGAYPILDDLVVWSKNLGGTGHIGVVRDAGPGWITVVDSNWDRDGKGKMHTVGMGSVLGWFRKKGTARPLMRFLHPGSGDHVYGVDTSENFYGAGYIREQDMGRAFDGPAPGTVRVYSYRNIFTGHHFTTTFLTELGTGAAGYVLESRRFFVYPASNSNVGTLAMHRWRNELGGHFFSIYPEINGNPWPWAYEGIAWRVLPN